MQGPRRTGESDSQRENCRTRRGRHRAAKRYIMNSPPGLFCSGRHPREGYICCWTTANTGITPKDTWKKNETQWQAAVRELAEETGITDVQRVADFCRRMEYRFVSSRKGTVHKRVTYFIGRTQAKDVTVSEEHVGFAWLEFDQAIARLTFDSAREILRHAHQRLEEMTSGK